MTSPIQSNPIDIFANSFEHLRESTRLNPSAYAEPALVDRATRLLEDVTRMFDAERSSMSPEQRFRVSDYIANLEADLSDLTTHSSTHTFGDVVHTFPGSSLYQGPDGLPEETSAYSNGVFLAYIDRTKVVVELIEGLEIGDSGQAPLLDDGIYTAGPFVITATFDSSAVESFGSERTDDDHPSWLTEPREAIEKFRNDPDSFYEDWMSLSDEERSLAMFSLQQAAQTEAQITQLMTNLMATMHSSAMGVARNLKA